MIAAGQHRLWNYNWLHFIKSTREDEPNRALLVTSMWYDLVRALCKGNGLLGDCLILWALV